jgi:hypothetical protein
MFAIKGKNIPIVIPSITAVSERLYEAAFYEKLNKKNLTTILNIAATIIPPIKPGIENANDYIVINPLRLLF